MPGRWPRTSSALFRARTVEGKSIARSFRQRSDRRPRTGSNDLEAIVHPQCSRGRARFLQDEHAQRRSLAVLEVPLLFEAGGDRARRCHRRRQRHTRNSSANACLLRPGMTDVKFEAVVARQLPEPKSARARISLWTPVDRSKTATAKSIASLLSSCRSGPRLTTVFGATNEPREKLAKCARSFSTPKRQASIRKKATGLIEDRLHRDFQPHSDGARVSSLYQSRARRAD